MFKCADCGRQFVSSKIPDSETIIREYIEDKLTLRQISARHGICIKTVWNKLKDMRHVHVISKDRDVVINMDTTYWGRGFGLMIIKDTFRDKILWYKFVRNETVAGYCEGIDWLRSQGFTIYGIVCDGMRGLFKELRQYRLQMCQFHMIQIVRRHLTTTPELEASGELLHLAYSLSKIPEAEFRSALKDWYNKWQKFLSEKTVQSDGKSHFKHPRTRAAYNSIRYYLPWLWTCERYPDLHIPNTNSAIESLNQRLKTLLRNHSGISKERRKKLLAEFIATNY